MAVIKLIDSATGELTSYSDTTTWFDGTPMDDSKVDNVIYRKSGGVYYRRNFGGGVNVRWFGAKGDGVTDDTAAFQAAIALSVKYGYAVDVPSSETPYKISNIDLPSNTTIRGTGAMPLSFGEEDVPGSPISNTNASTLLIPTGAYGFKTVGLGGAIENISFLGERDSLYGVWIANPSWSLSRIASVRFLSGYGVKLSACWRGSYTDIKIRRCGVGLYIGGDGAVNGSPFSGIMIERCRVAIYQARVSGGLNFTSNTFISTIIEDIRLRTSQEDYDLPLDLIDPSNSIQQDLLARVGLDENSLCAGVMSEADTQWNFVSFYAEQIDGPHFLLGQNCDLTMTSGYMSQGIGTLTAEATWRGEMFNLLNGRYVFLGVSLYYNVDDSTYTSPVIIIPTVRPHVFSGMKLAVYSTGNRKLYGGTTYDPDEFPDLYERGLYQNTDNYFKQLTARKSKYNFNVISGAGDASTTLTTNTNNTIDLGEITTGFVRYAQALNDGNQYVLTFSNTKGNNLEQGTRFSVAFQFFQENQSSLKILAGSNVVVTNSFNLYKSSRYTFNFIVLGDGRFLLLDTSSETVGNEINATPTIKGIVNQTSALTAPAPTTVTSVTPDDAPTDYDLVFTQAVISDIKNLTDQLNATEERLADLISKQQTAGIIAS